MTELIINYEIVHEDGGDPYGKPEVSFSTDEGQHLASTILPHEFPEDGEPGESWGDVADAEEVHREAITEVLANAQYYMEQSIKWIIDALGDGVDPAIINERVKNAMKE